ncbi:MarR family transcriptional regulator [Rhodobacteraceae bacterium WD3A24]|nr:MarR family transcriptional regulator [Rhodobacteraceae bacterium WD3A24]
MEIHDMAGHLIRRLHQISVNAFHNRAREAGFDLTPVQFAALDAIRATPGIDQARVASMIAYDRATIGGVIERLVQKGYVRRVVNPRDRRARELTLTEEGRRVFDAILPVVESVQEDILRGLSDEERESFRALARKAAGKAQGPSSPDA